VIGLDEVHFFDFSLVRACVELRAAGKTVILTGLDHDMWGREFPWIGRLKALADEVEIIAAPCSVCGGAARFSQRMTPYHGDLVGGAEAYEPRCPGCFTPLEAPAPAYSADPGG
jgi:thymidine kinase